MAFSPALLREADIVRECVARRGLHEYLQRFWHIAEPGVQYVDGAYMQAMCEFAEACIVTREIKRAVVCIPTRMGKSTLWSVLAQSYKWVADGVASHRFMAASYDPKLVERDAQRICDVINSDLHQACWPHVQFDGKVQALKHLKLEGGGRRHGTTPKAAGGTGWGSQTQIFDDLLNVKQAASAKELEDRVQWVSSTMATRIDGDPADFVRILTQQRLAEEDPAGVAIEQGWTPFVLPMGDRDGKRWFNLLHPDLWSEKAVQDLAAEIGGDRQIEAQLRQNPVPKKGSFVDDDWVMRFDVMPVDPRFVRWYQVWDLATKGRKESHSRTAGMLYFVHAGAVWTWDCHLKTQTYPQAKASFLALQEQPLWANATRIYIEAKANGPALVDELRASREDLHVRVAAKIRELETGALSKEDRLALQSAKIEDGKWFVRRCSQNEEFVSEVVKFPGAKHNEAPDLIGYALREALDGAGGKLLGKSELLKKILRPGVMPR